MKTATSWAAVSWITCSDSGGDSQLGDRQDLHAVAASSVRRKRGGGVADRGLAGCHRECRGGCALASGGPAHRHADHPGKVWKCLREHGVTD